MKKLICFLTISFFVITGCGQVTETIVMSDSSMEPTIIEGGEVSIVDVNNIKRGDIVAFKDFEEDDLIRIKRVVGLPDEVIKLGGGDERQLVFKEKRTQIDPNEKDVIKKQANETLSKVENGEDFTTVGIDEEMRNPELITYSESDWKFTDEINEKIAEKLPELELGEVYSELIESSGEYTVTPQGEFVELTGFNIVKLLDKREQEREVSEPKKVYVSHILIAYKGSERAQNNIARSKDEAYELAQEIKEKIDSGEDFATLANKYSDDFGNNDKGGMLETPAGSGQYVNKFESAALSLSKEGQVSDIIETEFGYHIIKADSIDEALNGEVKETQVKYARIFYSTVPSQWKDTGLNIKYFRGAEVQFNQAYQPYVSIQFNDEGAKLFEKITERNIDKPLAIFVGGDLITAPTVRGKITGGSAQIEGNFSIDEAGELASDLNTAKLAYFKLAEELNSDVGKVIIVDLEKKDIEILEEEYLSSEMQNKTLPGESGLGIFEVPEDQYFVLGDNRISESYNRERYFIEIDDVVGKVLIDN